MAEGDARAPVGLYGGKCDLGRGVAQARRGASLVEDLDIVRRALRLFLDALPRRLRFEDVAEDLGTTPDILRVAYERLRINPRTQLRAARFERLHLDLRAARHANLSDALVRWGFAPTSPDVLADYRKRYGHHPQTTLDAALASRDAQPD